MTKRERTKNAALQVRYLALDAVVRKWTDMAEFFARRPATVMCVIVGAFICVGMSTWALVKSENTSDAISQRILTSCARGPLYTHEVRENCRLIFDRILKDPTPQQVEELRELVEAR